MQGEQFEQFKVVLRKLATELENIWIEKEAFRGLILSLALATSETLDQMEQDARDNPDIRKIARKRFARMWDALDQSGDAVWIEEILNSLPPTGKPN
jgi:hypothetical protein